jgi:hypothetical protein
MNIYPSCPNISMQLHALEAYTSFLKTAGLGSAGSSCAPPCQFNILKPKLYADVYRNEFDRTVVLRMPAIIQLTESSFSYPFMSFAAEFGGQDIPLPLF